MKEPKNSQKEYFSFGSDDIVIKHRENDNSIEDSLKTGKEAIKKFGSFLSSSVQQIVKRKSVNEENVKKKVDVIDEDLNVKNDNKINEIKQISSKIGLSFQKFGVC